MMGINSNLTIQNKLDNTFIKNDTDKCMKLIETTAYSFSATETNRRKLAATKIQKLYRKYVAAKSYKYMFEGGQNFKKYKELKSSPSNTLEYITKLQSLSSRFINEIKEQLGELTEQEKNFVTKISLLNNLTLKHQTQYKLHQDDKQQQQKLTLFSSLYLKQHDIRVKNHTIDEDIEKLKNQDFVFFSIDFSGSDLSTKPSGCYLGDIDYGYRAYTIKQDQENFSYFTLTDHLDNFIKHTISDVNDIFYDKFPEVSTKVKRNLFSKLDGSDVPIFTKKDIPYALAYHCIDFVRECNDNSFSNYVYGSLNLKDIDTLFNSIFNPEAHIPRLVVTNEFAEHILREPNLDEVYNGGDINKILGFCFADYAQKKLLNQPVTYSLSYAAMCFDEIIEKASIDGNIEILKFSIHNMENLQELKITHMCCDVYHILGYKIQLAILENNMINLKEYLKQIPKNSYLPDNAISPLFNRDNCEEAANLILNFIQNRKNNQQLVFMLQPYDEIDLYVLANKFKEIPFYPNPHAAGSIQVLFNERINLSTYAKHQSKYINYIAYQLIELKQKLPAFTKEIKSYLDSQQNSNTISIDEDNIFLMINNYYLTESSRNTLKNAFIESGMLVPNKQIKASFYINNNSACGRAYYTNENDNFIVKEDSLKNYAANRYNIYL